MKQISKFSPFFLIFSFLFSQVISQSTNSCNSKLQLKGLPFDTSTLNCNSVWAAHGFILRYVKAEARTWNFVLSAPNPNSYMAIGFSTDGFMVGSDALAGWVGTDGIPTIQRYHLGGKTSASVEPNAGNLTLRNTTIVVENGQINMVFQLIDTETPLTQLLYAVGPDGRLPSKDNRLVEHKEMVKTSLDFATGESQTLKDPNAKLRRSHGVLNMLSWGIMMPIGAMVARYLRKYDPLWFYSHIMIQSVAFILGVSGIICGLVLNDRLDENVDRHKTIGIIVLLFGCLQVIAFLARPDKESKVRKFWNWYHFTVGRVLIMLAVVNVFIGIQLADAGSGWKASYAVVLVIFFISGAVFEFRLWLKK
ncbi:hypothetical protein Leryth_017845 [Lithospermum erythrorhizon]|nr:hypothetical protein Leryth_017845 [Lithospermum erythrorhizon]